MNNAKTQNLLLSIIIPVYNAEKFISKCLESIINQNISNELYEIILVNDGSSDNSENICLNFQKNLPNVKYFSKSNSGPGHTRNYGLNYAIGNYIWFIDADDYLIPDTLDKLFETLKSEFDLYVFGYQNVDLKGNIISKTIFPNQEITSNELLEKKYFLNQVWLKLIKRSVLLENNILFKEDVRGPEDFHFSFRLLLVIKKIKTINIICYNYIVNPSSLMNTRSDIHLNNLANDSLVVGNDLRKILQKVKQKDKNILFNNWLNNYLYGFLYSLIRFNYNITFVKEIIIKLKENGNYPINTSNMKLKTRVFMMIANNKSSFILACFINRKIKLIK